MKSPHSLLLAALLPVTAGAQTFVDLKFSNNVQPTNRMHPNNSTLGPHYYDGPVFDFRNAGTFGSQQVDVRVEFIGLIDGHGPGLRETSTYEPVGWLPSYNNSGGKDDLGLYYRFDMNFAQQLGGVAWKMSFFAGDGTFSSPLVLSGVRLLMYDHDGEQYQSESIRAYANDGLTGYQLHQSSGIHTHDEGGSIRFDSRGSNHSETSPEGGMILYYENTSSIRFDMLANSKPGLRPEDNGIFTAVDGNLSLNGGGTSGFGPLIVVPEPTTSLMAALSAAALLVRRTRRQVVA